MDGSHRQVLIDSHIKWPNGITLDRADRRLFWVDAKMDIIGSCDYGPYNNSSMPLFEGKWKKAIFSVCVLLFLLLDGSNRRVVLAGGPAIGHPFSISVFEDWI